MCVRLALEGDCNCPCFVAVEQQPPTYWVKLQIGDFVIHTHCEALSEEQQREGVAELLRWLDIVPAAERDMRFCILSDLDRVRGYGRWAADGIASGAGQQGSGARAAVKGSSRAASRWQQLCGTASRPAGAVHSDCSWRSLRLA